MAETAARAQFAWAGRVAAESVASLGVVRLVAGLQALATEGAIWVRGPQLDRESEAVLARVPWEARFELLDDGELRRRGRVLPEGTLPAGKWLPLSDFLAARVPSPVLPGNAPLRVAVELRPGAVWREPNLVEVAARDWLAWVETAPQIRLARLSFAWDVKAPEHVLVRGTPLPPLPGTRFVEAEGVAVPAGSTWWPQVSAATLRTALGADKPDLAVLHADGTYLRVPRSAWIEATRAAVRSLLKGRP